MFSVGFVLRFVDTPVSQNASSIGTVNTPAMRNRNVFQHLGTCKELMPMLVICTSAFCCGSFEVCAVDPFGCVFVPQVAKLLHLESDMSSKLKQ